MRTASASLRLRFKLCALLALSLFPPREARANGTFPAVSQLVSEPGEPAHMALRTTFGLVFSTDSGGNWTWICEDALGYMNTLPALAVLAGGPVVLGVPMGITQGRLDACDFALASGVADNVVDLSLVPQAPRGVIALGVDFVAHRSQVWESTDAGASFTPLGEPLPDFVATTLDAAPSNPDILYVSGMPQKAGGKGLLLRSQDHGKTFVAHEIPDSTGVAWPYIGAIDPAHPDKVYVRLADVPGRLKVTEDGGLSFAEPLQIDYEMQGFALSPDGKTVLVSSPAAGTYRGDSAALQFERVACSGVSCLMWNSSGLFACGDQSIDGYVVGRSLDEGASFERTLDFSCIRPDSECGSTTSVGSTCPALWPPIEMQLAGFGACDPKAAAPPVFNDCLSHGGQPGGAGGAAAGNAATGGAGRAGGVGGTGGASAGAGGKTVGGTPTQASSGCTLARESCPLAEWLVLASLAGRLARRKKKHGPQCHG